MSTDISRLYSLLQGSIAERNLHEAERIARKIISADPNNAPIFAMLGSMLNDQQRNQEAEPLYREAIRLDPNCAPVYNNLGVLLGQEGRLQEAEKVFHEAVRVGSMTNFGEPAAVIDAYANLGQLCYIAGRLPEAQKFLRECLSRSPHHANAQRLLTEVSRRLTP
jgi:Tfp pilus assembly protein PilF